MRIVEGDLDDPRVAELIRIHLTRAREETAPNSSHALDTSGLRAPHSSFWTIWENHTLLGCGALRMMSPGHGEVKSMHTAEAHRGRGVGGVMLRHIISVARARNLTRLSLETGSWDYFKPSHAFYQKHGFTPCGPYEHYIADPNSAFFTLDLATPASPPSG